MDGIQPNSHVSTDSIAAAYYARNGNDSKPYKERYRFSIRALDARNARLRHPNNIPLIVERYGKEIKLPVLKSYKFLIPGGFTVAEFQIMLRRRLELNESHALFLLVNGRSIPGNSITFREVFENEKDNDGFLYLVFASQEVFGG